MQDLAHSISTLPNVPVFLKFFFFFFLFFFYNDGFKGIMNSHWQNINGVACII